MKKKIGEREKLGLEPGPYGKAIEDFIDAREKLKVELIAAIEKSMAFRACMSVFKFLGVVK